MDSTNTRNNILDWPLAPEDVKEFEAGRTDMRRICNGVGTFVPVLEEKESRFEEIGMIRRMERQDTTEVKRPLLSKAFKPPFVEVLFRWFDLIPLSGFLLLIRF